MTAKLSFKTTQTPYGMLHSMRITGGNSKLTQGAEFHLFRTRPVSEYLSWVGPVYTAENGTAWRIGRNVVGGLVAWKSMKITNRFGSEAYRMRSVPGGYKGDFVTSWKRSINGQTYRFTEIRWNAGKDGVCVKAVKISNDEIVHEWHSK